MLNNFRLFKAAVKFYQLCKTMPLQGSQKDQLLRASASVGQNLSEGYGRLSPKDKKRFYRIALGSLRECEMIVAQENLKHDVLSDLMDFLGGGLYKLAR